MSITLPEHLQSFVDQLVANGAYSSPEAVLREAMERLRNEHAHFQELKASFDEAVAELERGEGLPLDFAEIKRKVREKVRDQSSLRGTG